LKLDYRLDIMVSQIYLFTPMLEKVKGLNPCPVCGSTDISWSGYRYSSLKCCHCGYEVYPEDEFATEEEFIKEWNEASNIGNSLKICDEKIKDYITALNKEINHKDWLLWKRREIFRRCGQRLPL
jgi:hypothetical protein